MASNSITIEYRGRIAIITLNQPDKLNSLTQDGFYLLGERLREVAKRDEVTITVLTGTGRFFSAGADASGLGDAMAAPGRLDILKESFLNNIDLTRTFYAHPKVLVVALNGPVVGLPAALVGFADFVYALPHAFLLIPFASLGLAVEGGAAHALRERLGVSKAKEALLMSKRIASDKLLACGFVNKILRPAQSNDGAEEATGGSFLDDVLKEVEKDLGSHLSDASLLDMKEQISRDDRNKLDRTAVGEAYTAVDRILAGVPREQMKKLAKTRKSKL